MRGYLSTFVIVISLLSSSSVYCQEEKVEDIPTNNVTISISESSSDIDVTSIVEELRGIAGSLEQDAEQINSQQQLAVDGLIHQKSIAKSSWFIFGSSVVATLISIVGIYFLIQNLREAKIASNSALRAAIATEENIKENRAWITPIIPPQREYLKDKNGRAYAFEIVFRWENSGVTPGQNISIISAGLEDSKNLPDENLPKPPSEIFAKKVNIGFLSKGQSIPVPFNFGRDIMDRVIQNQTRMFICTIASFETAFGEFGTVEQWVQVIYTGDPGDSKLEIPPLENWDSAPVGARCFIKIKKKES